MEPLIHYVSLEDVLTQPDALVARCGTSGDWTTKRNLVTCPRCRELGGLSASREWPCSGGERLEPAEET